MQTYHAHLLTFTNQKLVVANWHYAKVSKTYNYLVFPIKLGNNSWKSYFLEGKTCVGHKCIFNHFNQIISTNCKGLWFLTITSHRSSNNVFVTIIFLERFLCSKKMDMELVDIFDLLFCILSFIFPQRIILFFFKNKNYKIIIYIFMSFQCNYTIGCVIYD
jgi:hypothetical protein